MPFRWPFLEKHRDRGPKRLFRGTHRTLPLDDTYRRAQIFRPIAGITRVANVTGLDRVGLPVVMVVRPNARSLSVDQGKGLDLTAAIVSGLMEAIERHHGETALLPLKLGSYAELCFTHPMANIGKLAGVVNSPYHEDLRILWTEGFDLVQDRNVWLPYETVHLDYRLPMPEGSGCFLSTRTGVAAGNHPLEALTHALCEAIERDALTLWALKDEGRRRKDRIDLASIRDPCCREVLEKIEATNLSVAAWNITSDLGIPAFVAQVVELSDHNPTAIALAGGSGCHLAPEIALLRALTEALQTRLTIISGARDDLTPEDYALPSRELIQSLRSWLKADGPMLAFSWFENLAGDDFQTDLELILSRLDEADLDQAIAVDLSRPEIGLPVFRVVVPGLEDGHQSDGYVPGPRALAILEAQEVSP